MMKIESPDKVDRLDQLIETLQIEGNLSNTDAAELESILMEDEKAREWYFLKQELHTMLEVDKSIRLELANDLLPDNVIPLPSTATGIEPEPQMSRLERLKVDQRKSSAKHYYRTATSMAAMIAGVVILIGLLSVSDKIGKMVSSKLPDKDSDLVLATPVNKSVSYHKDIVPILTDNCLGCHGEDESKRKADLRLDHAESTTGGETPVIIRGNPESSELIARVSSHDPDYQMPPPTESQKGLSPEQIALLSRWIEQGAKYESTWSLITP